MIPEIRLNNVILDRVHRYNYLGISIQDNLCFDSHINRLITKAQHKIYVGRIRKYLSATIVVLVVKTFILPKLEYGDIFLTGTSKRDINRLQKLLNVCLRICFPSNCVISNVNLHRSLPTIS